MYNKLASYYDALVKDDQATQDWCNFIEAHTSATRFLEVACGSGEITLELARRGKIMDASDLSEQMLAQARLKPNAELVHFSQMDLRHLPVDKQYEGILCLCDSLNYITQEQDLQTFFAKAYEALEERGVLIFDVHSMDRLQEFEEEFYECGQIDGVEYEWSIEAHEDLIYQNFIFFDESAKPSYEQHVQRVYEPMQLKAMLEAVGFVVEWYTDFVHEGVVAGEKIFFVCWKGAKQ